MTDLSRFAVLAAWFLYAGGSTCALMYAVQRGQTWFQWATRLVIAGFAFQLVGLALIVAETGRAPWGTLYEWVMSASAIIVGATIVLVLRKPAFAALTCVLLGGVVVFMMAGLSEYTTPGALQPALQSQWLTFHVAMAMTGSALLLFGGVVSALYLVRMRWENRNPTWQLFEADDGDGGTTGIPAGAVATPERERESVLAGKPAGPGAALAQAPLRLGLGGRLPSTERLDDLARKVFTLAFPIYTLAVFAGAVWGEQAWGRYWGWDPKETTSFIIWGLFAAYLHARSTRDWKGRNAAIIGVIGASAVLFNSFFVNLVIAGLHSYA